MRHRSGAIRAAVTAIGVIATSFAAGPPAVATTGAWTGRGSASGAAIVFARLQGHPENYEIWTMGPHGGGEHRLTRNAVADHDPVWSPDGTRIAWVRYETQFNSGPSDLWIMDADGANKHRVTDHHEDISGPTWSPDGSRIAFTRGYGIFVINADGTWEHRISPEGSFDFDATWSPDGERIVFTSNGSASFDLFVMAPDGSGRDQLADTIGVSESGSAWSPDGTRIAFSGSHRTTGMHVDSMRSDGTGSHIVIDLYSGDAAWSPDGSRLAFYACSDLDCGLYQSSYRGLHVRPLGRRRGFSDIQPDFRDVLPTP